MAIVLPEDVERDIFQLIAHTDLTTGLALLQVARRVSHWIAPIIYNVVITGSRASDGTNRPKPIISQLDIRLYGVHIRHVLLNLCCPSENVELYLRNCPNITTLSIWCSYEFTQSALALIQKLPLKRISFNVREMYQPGTVEEEKLQLQQAFSSFSQITHFDVPNTRGFTATSHLSCLQYLPYLTHLSLPSIPFRQTPEWTQALSDIFDYCPKLKVVILLRSSPSALGIDETHAIDHKYNQAYLNRDGRVVGCIVDDYVEDWIRGVSGEPDTWDFGLKNIRMKD